MNRRILLWAAIAGLLAWLFSDALFGSGMFVFRDAAHYYYPLFQYCADEWAAGRVPLWNPYENLGMPLAADPTASVFYPGKLIFALPLDYAWAYKLYILGHLLLAAAGAYRLARHWKASVEAAGVSALSYAFCGNVLFQYCNVVFLVGAAWLPAALKAADRMLVERSLRRAVGFGVVLALMVLGGDPQMAYNAGLLAAIYALWLWWCQREGATGSLSASVNEGDSNKDTGWQAASGTRRLLRSRPALLVLAAGAAMLLAAVQVLPSIEFARRSQRVAGHPGDALLARMPPGSHQEHVYHFSVGPWRLAEYLWPNLSGQQFPTNRRWLEALPAEGRVWTPSLYMGLLPLLWALASVRLRRRRTPDSSPEPFEPQIRWLSWSVVLAVVASLGWYGPGWLIEEIRLATGGDAAGRLPFGPPFGGLYWLMTLLLPGYGWFRYPAKLLVVAALGLSVLAARGFDRTLTRHSPRFGRVLLGLSVLSTLAALAALAIRPFWGGWLTHVPPDSLFGPLDAAGAASDLFGAFAQTAVLCGLSWWLLRRGLSQFSRSENGTVPLQPLPRPGDCPDFCGDCPDFRAAKMGLSPYGATDRRRWIAPLMLLLVVVDLSLSNRWMVVCAPSSQWEEPSRLARAVEQAAAPNDPGRPYRVLRHSIWMRPGWRSTGSPDRLAEAMQWDRDTLWPKYNLSHRIPSAAVHGAMMPRDYRALLELQKVPVTSFAKYVILPGDAALPGGQRLNVDVADVSLWRNPRHLPRTWIVHHVDVLPLPAASDPAELRRRTEEVFFPGGRPRDLRRRAVVESDDRPFPAAPSGADMHGESCRVVRYGPQRVEIEAHLLRPGLVVLCDQFYPGWKLAVDGRPAPILRTNRVMRGAQLPPGRHRLVYQYRPASLLCGAILSLLGWIAAAACCKSVVVLNPRAITRRATK